MHIIIHEVVSNSSDFCSPDFFRDAVVVFILSILSLFLFSIVYAGLIHKSFMTDSLTGEKKNSGLFFGFTLAVLASSISASFRPF
ncbi:hypothetical protein [Bacillus infantis]|uniref:hypothetical protein n=1 Tax=Bacillus infantis TaxID=324767 RepID=UPI00209E2BF8|nr:hypothetical protein [Bacillus infantis]MCP1158189.1 hypothetical protein [Bacillus infantis]